MRTQGFSEALVRDQILGCILGGAIGDAIGCSHEGKRPPIEISDDDDLLRLVVEVLPDTQVRDRLIALTEIEEDAPLREIARRFGCSGYVVESIPLALCGASRIQRIDFKTVLMELIACGGDTDTNASIAGQVAGALIGRGRLPEEMIALTPDRRLVEAIACEFSESLTL
jgi:ADP-ribosylglycohydrolase